jgi:hypothetical protein
MSNLREEKSNRCNKIKHTLYKHRQFSTEGTLLHIYVYTSLKYTITSQCRIPKCPKSDSRGLEKKEFEESILSENWEGYNYPRQLNFQKSDSKNTDIIFYFINLLYIVRVRFQPLEASSDLYATRSQWIREHWKTSTRLPQYASNFNISVQFFRETAGK